MSESIKALRRNEGGRLMDDDQQTGEWFYRTDEGWCASLNYEDAKTEAARYARDRGDDEIEIAFGRPMLIDGEIFPTGTEDELLSKIDEENPGWEECTSVMAGIEPIHMADLRQALNATFFEWVKRHGLRGGQLDLSQHETITVEQSA